MLVSAVQPVAILSAAFWTVWSLLMYVGDMIGDQDEFAYSRIGREIVWNVARCSFCFPHCVAVRDLIILIVLLALLSVLLMSVLKVSFGSNVSPSIFGSRTVGMSVLVIMRLSCVLYSAGSGVKRVAVFFVAQSCSWFCVVHVCMV